MKNYSNGVDDAYDQEEESGDGSQFLNKLLAKIVSVWPWMILCSVILGAGAWFKLKYADTYFTANASVLIEDEKKTGGSAVLEDIVQLKGKQSVDNEIEIIKSRKLMEKVVNSLQLYVSYFYDGRIKKTEIYNARPVSLNFLTKPDLSKGNGQYVCKIDKGANTITFSGNDKTITGKIGSTITLPEGEAFVYPTKVLSLWGIDQPLYLTIGRAEDFVGRYMSSLTVNAVNKQVSIMNVSVTDVVPEKAELVTDNLIAQYIQASLEERNRTADSTIKFINDRVRIVAGELSGVEQNIEQYSKSNEITDVKVQADALVNNSGENLKAQAELEVKLNVINNLESGLRANPNERLSISSSQVAAEGVFEPMVNQYNLLQIERDKTLMNKTPDHPAVKALDQQLQNVRTSLLGSFDNVKRELGIRLGDVRKNIAGTRSQISTIPGKQRTILDLSRKQGIQQELYIYLLTKREEVAISKSSNKPIASVLDSAVSHALPNNKSLLIIAIILGIALPLLVSYIRDFLNTRIQSLDDVISSTVAPVLAEIGHNTENEVIAITSKSRSVLAERLRSLRTNLQYLLPNESDKVILLTSSMSGEGKSFLSMNLAETLALAGKKVLLMELDLRKPKITESLGLKKQGLTNYLISNDSNWQQWVQPAGNGAGFDVFSCGPIPPNPSELLLLPKVGTLISDLKKNYDYLIMDTAPVGLVTDAQILASQANVTLFVVRHNYTTKPQLKILDKTFRKNILPKLNIIVNDIVYKKGGYGSYYAYDYYGYGYGDYNLEGDTKKKSKSTKHNI